MKKNKILIVIFLFSINVISQDIKLSKDIAYIDNVKYVKIEKIKRNLYIIRNVKTNEKIIKIELFKTKKIIANKVQEIKIPEVNYIEIKKKLVFETDNIKNKIDIVKFLFIDRIIFLNGKLNEKYYDYFIKEK